MGRTDGHQWGDLVAAYGEVFMATVTHEHLPRTHDHLQAPGHTSSSATRAWYPVKRFQETH
jgi:hypothetical protein